jgi:hypothetical protein
MFFDALQVELHKKYGLGHRPTGLRNETIHVPKKIPMFHTKDKEKEAIIITQKVDSSQQVKVKDDSKEMEKITQPFNIEQELGKIKILVPKDLCIPEKN